MEKRWRAAALQDAGAMTMTNEPRGAFWSAPALWRFGRETKFNAKSPRRQGAGKTKNFLRLCVKIGRAEINGSGRDAENGNRDIALPIPNS
jgi:hypothetical protein